MVLLDAVVLFAVLGLLVYGTIRLLAGLQAPSRPGSQPGVWRVAHYDRDGETRIVVQKLSLSGSAVLDEHVVGTVRVDDPAYDEKFLSGMAAARQRQALFEVEEDGTS